MAITTPIPQAARRLPTAHPVMAKMLTITALYKLILGSIIIDLYNYVTVL
jgi:hypothetical protein